MTSKGQVTAACAECGRPFVRKHPSQRFCPKRGHRHFCKDRYHNRRRFEADEITDARRRYLNGGSNGGTFQYVGGFGPWDDHKDAF